MTNLFNCEAKATTGHVFMHLVHCHSVKKLHRDPQVLSVEQEIINSFSKIFGSIF